MAEKVLLKDSNSNDLLPITRGELVLDSSGEAAFHSHEFLATYAWPGLMSAEEKSAITGLTTIADSIAQLNGIIQNNKNSIRALEITINDLYGNRINDGIIYANGATFNGDVTSIGIIKGSQLVGTLNNQLKFNAGIFTAKTYDNSSAVTVNIPTKTSHLTNDSGFLTEHQDLSNYYTKSESESRYVNVTGDTMTGTLDFVSNPIYLKFNNSGIDSKIWEIESDAGFYTLYAGSGRDNNNTLHLYTHNYLGIGDGTPIKVNTVYQNGTVTNHTAHIFDTTITASGNITTSGKFIGSLNNTLTFSSGNFSETSYDNSSAITIKIPTSTSHLADGGNYVTALGVNGNYLTWTKGGATNNITVPYATSSDTLDGYHHDAFLKRSGGLMTGPITFSNNTALPQRVGQPYIVGIDAFNDGGTLTWSRANDVTVGNADKLDGYHRDHFYQIAPFWNDQEQHNVDELIGGSTFAYTSHGAPEDGPILDVVGGAGSTGYRLQLNSHHATGSLFSRTKGGNGWTQWRRIAWGTDIPTSQPSSFITSLTGYSKPTSTPASLALSTTDSLNTALGKLEYQASNVYTWMNLMSTNNGNQTIDTLKEVFDLLSGINADNTLVNQLLSKYLPLTGGTLTGRLNITSWDIPFTINRLDPDGGALINFQKNDISYGYLGFRESQKPVYVNANGNDTYELLHTNNYSSYALPLSGGTLTSDASSPLVINRASSNSAYINFTNINGKLGAYGVLNDGTAVFNTKDDVSRVIVHSGNIINYKAGDSNKLKGIDGSNYLRGDAITPNGVGNCNFSIGTDSDRNWIQSHSSKPLHINPVGNDVYINDALAATINSNVASATKLATPRRLWGNNFDGTGDVNGNIYMPYSNDLYNIINNHNNGNISINAASGSLYLGYTNTNTVYARGNYVVLDSGNYNTYTPTLTGTGASGTWGINITGNAETANKLNDNTAYKAWGQTFFENGKPKNVSGNLVLGLDDKIVKNAYVGGSWARDLVRVVSSVTPQASLGAYGTSDNTEFLYLGFGEFDSDAHLYINNNGNVKIGGSLYTLSNYKLDVNGTFRVTSNAWVDGKLNVGNAIYIKRTIGEQWGRPIYSFNSGMTSDQTEAIVFGKADRMYDSSVLLYNHVGDASGANSLRLGFVGIDIVNIFANGNVGIGTISPAYKLDVNGITRSHGFVKLNSSDEKILLGGGSDKAISDFVLKTELNLLLDSFLNPINNAISYLSGKSDSNSTLIKALEIAISDLYGNKIPEGVIHSNGAIISDFVYQRSGQCRVTDVTETVTALGTNNNYLTWTLNGNVNNITIPYSTCSGYSNYLLRVDSRNVNYSPYDPSLTYKGLSVHLKSNTTDSLNDGNTYHASMYIHPWGDSSGGHAHNLGFTDSGNIYHRFGGANWSAWRRLAFASEIEAISSTLTSAISKLNGVIQSNKNSITSLEITISDLYNNNISEGKITANGATIYGDLSAYNITVNNLISSSGITLYSSSGDSPHLTFQRTSINDGYYDWDMYVTGGYFKLRYNDTNLWHEALSMFPNNIITSWTVTSNGFIKSGSNDNYVLLGAGGHKAISDFLLKSELANNELTTNVTTIDKTLTVTADWMDTGIKGTDLTTGTYIVQVYTHNTTDTNDFWHIYASGIMSWYSSGTNDNESEEIILHRSGHDQRAIIYLRTKTEPRVPGYLKLQIAGNTNLSSGTYTFKFKRVI